MSRIFRSNDIQFLNATDSKFQAFSQDLNVTVLTDRCRKTAIRLVTPHEYVASAPEFSQTTSVFFH